MSLTQSVKIAREHINNALANLSDSMQSECADPVYSLDLALSDLESAAEYITSAQRVWTDIRPKAESTPKPSPALSCLLCGHQKQRAVWHEGSGQFVCVDCRSAQQSASQHPPFKCKADKSGIGGNEPQDCNWPVCGCDPYADKVIAALEESGALKESE